MARGANARERRERGANAGGRRDQPARAGDDASAQAWALRFASVHPPPLAHNTRTHTHTHTHTRALRVPRAADPSSMRRADAHVLRTL